MDRNGSTCTVTALNVTPNRESAPATPSAAHVLAMTASTPSNAAREPHAGLDETWKKITTYAMTTA